MIPSTTSRLRFRQKESLVCSKGSWVENLEMESVNLHTSGYASSEPVVRWLECGLASANSQHQKSMCMFLHLWQLFLEQFQSQESLATCLSDGSERELDSLTTGKEKGSWALTSNELLLGWIPLVLKNHVSFRAFFVSCFSKSSSHQKWV